MYGQQLGGKKKRFLNEEYGRAKSTGKAYPRDVPSVARFANGGEGESELTFGGEEPTAYEGLQT